MKRWRKIIFRIAGVLLLLLLLIIAGGYFYLQSDAGKSLLAAKVSELVGSENLSIRIERLDGSIPLNPTCGLIAVGDADGEWLIVEGVSFSCSLRALLRGRIRLERFDVDKIKMLRRPRYAGVGETVVSGKSKNKFRIPPLRVELINLNEIYVEETVFGRALDLGVQGSVETSGNLQRISVSCRLSENTIGPLELEVELNRVLTEPAIKLTASSGGLRFDGLTVNDLFAEGEMSFVDGTPDGVIALKINCMDVNCEGRTKYKIFKDRITLRDLLGTVLDTELTGGVSLNYATHMLKGTVAVRSDNLRSLGRLLNQDVSGAFSGKIDFTPVGREQSLLVELDIDGLEREMLRIQAIHGSLSVSNIYHSPVGFLRGSCENAEIAKLKLKELEFAADGNASNLHYSVQAEGEFVKECAVRLAGSLRFTQEVQSLAITNATLSYAEWRMNSASDLLLTHATAATNAILELVPCEIVVNGVSLAVRGQMRRDGQLEASVRVADAHISSLPLNVISNFSGRVRADASLKGTLTHPVLNAELSVSELRLEHGVPNFLPPVEIDAIASLVDDRFSVQVKADAGEMLTGSAKLNMPVRLSLLPFKAEIDRISELDYSIASDLDLKLLNQFPVMKNSQISGRAKLNIASRETVDSGELTGELIVSGAAYDHYILGTAVRNIDVHLRADNRKLVIDRARAADRSDGKISAAGEIDLTPSKGFPFSFDVRADRMEAINMPSFRATSSGDFHVSGSMTNLKVRVTLVVDPAVLNIDNLPPSSPPSLIDKEPEPNKREESVSSIRKLGGDSVDVLVRCSSPGGVFVRGKSLDSMWGGSVEISNGQDHWRIIGDIEPRRGSFSFLGRSFRIEKGYVRFDGSWPPIPFLDLTARHQRADITAWLRVTGKPDKPEITMESDPPLPEDEIMAHVLFGKDLSTITPLQAVQIGMAIHSMNSQDSGKGFNFMESTRDALGVSTLEWREEGSGEGKAELAAGKYLNSGVYIEVNRSMGSEGATHVTAEYELTPNLTLETDAGSDMRSGIRLNWRMDY